MSLRLVKQQLAQPDREEFFLAHYERVFGWALHLTAHDLAAAEDLTHDLFVQLSLNPPDFARIENLENYLFVILKNLNRFERKKAARFPHQISITDYDSAETGLQTLVSFDNQLQVWQELEIACHYACERKETARAGSAFVLRFFHGYYPSEIGRILCGSRSAVGELLRVARAEVRAVLEAPQKIAFFKNIETISKQQSAVYKPEAIIDALRERIFASRKGECLPETRLRDIYEVGSEKLVDRKRLAHFVACPVCLEKINKILGLTDLSNRFPPDNLGPETNALKAKRLSTISEKQKSIHKFRRRLQSIREHEPRELWVSVNGFVLGSQPVKTAINEQTLGLEPLEKIELIEVYSEQNVRLCALSVEQPPAGDFVQTAEILLSDERSLEINLSFCGNWKNVKVVYAEKTEAPPGIPALGRVPDGQNVLSEGWTQNEKNWFWRRFAPFLTKELWLRPTAVTIVIAVPLIALLIFWRVSLDEWVVPNSRQIIEKATLAEQTVSPGVEQNTKRIVEIEERYNGATIARYRMEIWRRSIAAKENSYTTAKRIFGENNKIIAGEWSKADGTRHRKSVEGTALDEAIWNDLSIKTLNQNAEQIKVSEADGSYILNDSNLSVTIRKADFRVTEQTLLTGGGREFRFLETSFERRTTEETPPEVFSPNSIKTDAPLVLVKPTETETPSTKTEISPEIGNADTNVSETKPTINPINRPTATAEMEVEALNLLSAARGDLNEQISVVRDGRVLRITGVVDSAARKTEILRALAPISKNPAVEIRVQTVAEAVAEREMKKLTKPTEITLEQKDADGFSIPAEDDLRAYFSARGITDIDNEIRRFSQEMFARSRRSAQYAGALRQTAARFSPTEIESLTPQAKADFVALIKKHARNLQTEVRTLRAELAPVFGGKTDSSTNERINLNDISEVQIAAARLVSMINESDREIRAAFSASANNLAAQTLKTRSFWTRLQRIEATASALANN